MLINHKKTSVWVENLQPLEFSFAENLITINILIQIQRSSGHFELSQNGREKGPINGWFVSFFGAWFTRFVHIYFM